MLLFLQLFFLYKNKEKLDGNVFKLLIISIIFTIGSELSFTFYVGVFDLSNLVGHFFKIIAFYLIYKAVIQVGLTKPYNLLFRRRGNGNHKNGNNGQKNKINLK